LKSFLFFSNIIAAIGIIITGHLFYQHKLETIAEESIALSSTIQAPEPSSESATAASSDVSLTGLLKEWTDVLNSDEVLSITAFGSTSITNAENPSRSWPLLLEEKLSDLADVPEIETTIVDVERLTSRDVLNSEFINEVIDSKPDVLLFEPFILNDNGNLPMDVSLQALEGMLEQIQEELPDTALILMPANPLPGANFYLKQIEELESFAKENDYLYAYHWLGWPSTEDGELEDYIANGRPNEAGHALWAEAMLEFLTKE
jgi:hypothetical protein